MEAVSPEVLEQAAATLRAGGIVAYPSETVWGLAVHPQRPDALARLRAAKGRAEDKPMQASCADVGEALALAQPSAALRALSALWPGPLSVVAPAAPTCPPALAPGGRVGLRLPAHGVARALIAAAGTPLLTTSCNRSGEPPVADHAAALASGLADLVLPDGGVGVGGLASTVVELPSGRILRGGAVDPGTVRSLLRATGAGA